MKKIIPVLTTITGALAGGAAVNYINQKELKAKQESLIKMSEFYNILVTWLEVKQQGKSLEQYFKRNNYKTVAIYGMKELGERLYAELKDSEIEVKYAIDKDKEKLLADIDIYSPDEQMEPVDVIVVTAIHYFGEIEREMSQYADCPVISLEDVIYEIS